MAVKIGGAVGAAVILLGLISLIIGLATEEWANYRSTHFGLWEVCEDSMCIDGNWAVNKDALRAVRAMIVMAVLAAFGAGAAALIHLAMGALDKGPPTVLPIVALLLGIVSLVLTIVGVLVFAVTGDMLGDAGSVADTKADFGYSFALTIVGGILSPVGGGIYFALGRN